MLLQLLQSHPAPYLHFVTFLLIICLLNTLGVLGKVRNPSNRLRSDLNVVETSSAHNYF
jgi:hypothetical protein